MALTLKQQRFVRELAVAPSATEAARRAGYAESSAYQRAYEAVRNSEVSAAIAAERAKVEARCLLSREEWMAGLTRIAKGDDGRARSMTRISALVLIGKAHGWLGQRLVIGNEQALRAMFKAAGSVGSNGRSFVDPDMWNEFVEAVEKAMDPFG